MATPEEEVKTTKERVAEHEYLDAQGQVVDAEEDAYGIRYTLLDASKPFEWSYANASPEAQRMLAIFGAKTLSTNESSGVRNGKLKGSPEAGPEAQLQAVIDRFALIADGQWIDRTREGVAVRIDKDALAQAICAVLVAEGKKSQSDIDTGHKAKVRQKLEEDPQFVKKSRQVPQVASEYARLVGRQTASVDDLLNI